MKSITKSLFVFTLLLAVSCASEPDEVDEPSQEESTESRWEPMETLEGQELDEAELQALLARLPELDYDEDDQVEFKRRDDSLPPPLTGEDVEGQWPPDLSAAVADTSPDGPLRAQAFRPEGEVEPPFQLALAFDRPVVEVGAVGTQQAPPVTLSPQVEGRWRWLGTQTVVFEPDDEWPMATEFEVELEAGLEAVDGSQLEETLRFGFATPAPEVVSVRPVRHGVQARDVPVAVVFNQPIDQESAQAISVNDGSAVQMRVADAEERAAVAEEHRLSEANDEDRVIALIPRRPYAYDRRVTVAVDGPIKSKEGPIIAMEDHTSTFRVHGAFRLTGIECGFHREPCRPGQPITLRFSNDIDDEESTVEVAVEPEVEDLNVRTFGTGLILRGDFQPHTTYEFRVGGKLVDRFGQELEGDRSRRMSVAGYQPLIAGPDQPMVVRPLDAESTIPVMVAGQDRFRVRVFDVEPSDWQQVRQFRIRRSDRPGGELVYEGVLEFSADEQVKPQQVPLDLSQAIGGGAGHAVVVVDQRRPEPRFHNFVGVYWLQKTDLAMDLTTDHREMTATVTRISDGSRVEGAEIRFAQRDRVLGRTNAEGMATFNVPGGRHENEELVVIDGDDSLVFPVQGNPSASQWVRWSTRDDTTSTLWYVVDDRQMYKPGETVKVRGWIRRLESGPRAEPVNVGSRELSYTVYEPRNNEIASGQVRIDDYGGFELDFEVPDEANLGRARIQLETRIGLRSRSHTHTVEFQEFRRPEYEITLETDEGPHLVEEMTKWEAEASYYAGGAVSGAETTWRFSESSGSYSPPGWSEWNFGQWRTWWSPWGRSGDSGGGVLPEEFEGSLEDETDGMGKASVEMEFKEPKRGLPRRVQGTVSVQDVDRQAWEASSSVLVHPSTLYVGLRSENNFVQRDEPWEVEAVVVDIDGDPVEGRQVELALKRRRAGDLEKETTCEKRSSEEAVSCVFTDLAPGSYRVVATVEDDRGRASESEIDFFVAGQDRSGAETAEEDDLILIPERDEYAPGDVARFSVQAPYYPLDAVMELRRDGLYHRERIELTEEDPMVEFEVEETMIPNVHLRVAGIGKGDAYAPEHFASANLEVAVSSSPRTLNVEVKPESDKIEPGAEMDVQAVVTDSEGRPVPDTQVLLYAVDESVLALSDYQLADPIGIFYPTRRARMSDYRSRSWLLLEADEDLEEQLEEATEEAEEARVDEPIRAGVGRSATGGGAGGRQAPRPRPSPAPAASAPMEMAVDMDDEMDAFAAPGGAPAQSGEAIALREVFDALAFYRSDLVTDSRGRVEITEEMPDSLTRYRVMAVAIEKDKRFGTGEADVTARKPLMISPSPPRFLNVGDTFEFPVVIHNQTGQDIDVQVAVDASPLMEWMGTPGRRIGVAADDRVEVRFPGRVEQAGTAKIQVAVASGTYSDAEYVEFPVLTPATTEAFATYGTIDAADEDAVLEALRVPQDVYPQFGGLEVSASSTQLQALTDAFIYLTNYPFMCSEQIASRMMSVFALYDVLDAFDVSDVPSAHEVGRVMNSWITELEQIQRHDGGFGFWPDARRSHPYVSIHATHALWRAQQEGYSVNSQNLRRAQNYVRNIDRHMRDYPPRARAGVEAYALHVLELMGDGGLERELDALVTRHGVNELPLEALGWLLPIAEGTQWEERFMQRITGQVQETAATAEFQETYDRGAHRILHTTRRTDGVVLDGLMRVDPDHYLVEKVVRGLLAHRQRGRWSNTQENVFILMALRRYFDTYEDTEPDFVARAWLGDAHIAEHAFRGRTTERYGVDVPMSYLHEQDETVPVVLQRDGEGRMYYRMGVRYAPTSRQLDPLSEGMTVERTYEAIDDPDDVRRVDGGWEVRAGARVRVELSMTVPARRYHVALVDWLPAGFEPLNPALSVTSVESDLTRASSDARRWGWWGWPWYEHQNLRDERVEAFASLVSQGVYTYSYVARATTPGEFIAMPAKAEEMYHPETFGRSMSEIVRVVGE